MQNCRLYIYTKAELLTQQNYRSKLGNLVFTPSQPVRLVGLYQGDQNYRSKQQTFHGDCVKH